MTAQIPPITGIARAKRKDAGTTRKSTMSAFVDLFRRMSPTEQQAALIVLEQIQRIGAPQLPTEPTT